MLEQPLKLPAVIVLSACAAIGQADKPPAAVVAGIPVNYDEARVGNYTLPDPLMLANGKPVRDAKTWNEKRRPEIVRLFEENQYGRGPGRPAAMSFDVFDKGTPALDGKAIRRQVTIYFSADKAGPKMDLLRLPAGQRHRARSPAAEPRASPQTPPPSTIPASRSAKSGAATRRRCPPDKARTSAGSTWRA